MNLDQAVLIFRRRQFHNNDKSHRAQNDFAK